jgi:hypothetical protein
VLIELLCLRCVGRRRRPSLTRGNQPGMADDATQCNPRTGGNDHGRVSSSTRMPGQPTTGVRQVDFDHDWSRL